MLKGKRTTWAKFECHNHKVEIKIATIKEKDNSWVQYEVWRDGEYVSHSLDLEDEKKALLFFIDRLLYM